MKKLFICVGAALTMAACSSDKAPQQKIVVVDSCSDVRAIVHNNHQRIGEAFAANDAYTIGSLELQNKAIIDANMQCFPKMQQYMAKWKKIHKDLGDE